MSSYLLFDPEIEIIKNESILEFHRQHDYCLSNEVHRFNRNGGRRSRRMRSDHGRTNGIGDRRGSPSIDSMYDAGDGLQQRSNQDIIATQSHDSS
jgi:hypothetical protein